MESSGILAFLTPTAPELLIILLVAVLVFGDRLPEVAKNAGRTLARLKQGLNDAATLKDDITSEVHKSVESKEVDEIKKEITGQS